MRRVCWACGIELRPKKNGVMMIEMASFGPAAIWDADLWHCPECGIEVVTGFAQAPWATHRQNHFQHALTDLTMRQAEKPTRRFWLNAMERDQYNERAAAAEAPRTPRDAGESAAGETAAQTDGQPSPAQGT